MKRPAFVIALAFAVTACGSSSSPTAPAAANNAVPTATTSVINGTVAAGSSAALYSTNNGAGAGMTVTVEGTNITATVNGAGQFVLSNVPAGAIVLRFNGAGANAQLNLGSIPAGTTITINVVVNGSSAELQEKTVNGDTEIEGRIESIVASASTLKVATRTVLVTPATIIRHGNTSMTLAQLAVGQRVHVKGNTTGTGATATTTATTIIVQNLNTSLPLNLEGTVSALAGTAASFTFTLDGRAVCGDSATEFKGGGSSPSFADLGNGDEVHVKGALRPTCVYAERINFEDEDDDADEFEAEGAVSGLSGTCPSITFTLAGKTIRTNSSTEFKGGACSAIANGGTVEAEGTLQTDGSVLAKKVEIEDDDDDANEWEARGAISGLTGTCPAITFTLNGKTVRANSSTRFDDITCAAIANGASLKVEGALQTDGSVLAKKIKRG